MLVRCPRFASTTSNHSGSQNMLSCSSVLSSPSSLGCAQMAKYGLQGARICPCPRHVIDQAIPSALVILNCWCNHMIGQQLAFWENICISVVSQLITMTVIFCCMGNTDVAIRTKKDNLASCNKLRRMTPHQHSPPFSSVLTAPMLLEDGAIITSRECTDQSVLPGAFQLVRSLCHNVRSCFMSWSNSALWRR